MLLDSRVRELQVRGLEKRDDQGRFLPFSLSKSIFFNISLADIQSIGFMIIHSSMYMANYFLSFLSNLNIHFLDDFLILFALYIEFIQSVQL